MTCVSVTPPPDVKKEVNDLWTGLASTSPTKIALDGVALDSGLLKKIYDGLSKWEKGLAAADAKLDGLFQKSRETYFAIIERISGGAGSPSGPPPRPSTPPPSSFTPLTSPLLPNDLLRTSSSQSKVSSGSKRRRAGPPRRPPTNVKSLLLGNDQSNQIIFPKVSHEEYFGKKTADSDSATESSDGENDVKYVPFEDFLGGQN